MKILLASHNAGKIAEFQGLFAVKNIEIIGASALSVPDVAETGLSFVENAIIKARHASTFTGLPAIADDSGLCVPALNHAPGIYSARYSGKGDQANNEKLLAELAGKDDRSAYFVCVLAYVRHPNDPLPVMATGIWHGQIAHEPKGENGFGYDPLFFIPELGVTSAQLSKVEKNAISHRARALEALFNQI